MIEAAHLKIMMALHQKGTLTQAADALCLTQSALSHQIRYLEKKLNVKLWQRCGRRLRLTPAGELLLQAAQQVMPLLTQTEQSLKALGQGLQGVLRIGVECYPCKQWLTQVVGDFLQQAPNIDIDIIRQFQFSGKQGLVNHHVDLLITPDPCDHQLLQDIPLFNYQLVLLISEKHRLADASHVTAQQFEQEVLFTFPVEPQRLDIFRYFLWPKKIVPKAHKQIESLAVMLQMVEHQRGVCVLPYWLAESYRGQYQVKALPIGDAGLYSTLYASIRTEDKAMPYINEFIKLGRASAL